MKNSADRGGCFRDLQNSSYPAIAVIALLFIQNYSNFKNKLKNAYLEQSMLSSHQQCIFFGKFS